MANVIKTCKVCGKRYEGCSNAEKYDGIFRYQTVACSPECGAIYLAQILKSRGELQDSVGTEQAEQPKRVRKKTEKKSETAELSDE